MDLALIGLNMKFEFREKRCGSVLSLLLYIGTIFNLQALS